MVRITRLKMKFQIMFPITVRSLVLGPAKRNEAETACQS